MSTSDRPRNIVTTMAVITLRSGLVERTAEATITFPDTGAALSVATTAPRPWWLYPAIGALSVLLLVGAVAVRKALRTCLR